MKGASERVATSLELAAPPPERVPVASDVALEVIVRCDPPADLAGGSLVAALEGAEPVAAALGAFEEGVNRATLVLRAPSEVGEFSLALAFPESEGDGLVFEASELRLQLATRAHATSVAVWGIEAPVAAGGGFAVHVGAKCGDGCVVAGQDVEVLDEAGRPLAAERLGETAWPGTAALFWCAVPLQAPSEAGAFRWSARFGARGLSLPHQGSEQAFGFTILPQPELRLTVEVVEAATGAAVTGAGVRVGPWRGATGADGVATIDLPRGEHVVAAWKAQYRPASRKLTLVDDTRVRLRIEAIPEENPEDIWI